MKICQAQLRQDRLGGKQVSCGKPADFTARYKKSGHYLAHTTYLCANHAQMARELVKVDRKDD